jgi:hypothetical protein
LAGAIIDWQPATLTAALMVTSSGKAVIGCAVLRKKSNRVRHAMVLSHPARGTQRRILSKSKTDILLDRDGIS